MNCRRVSSLLSAYMDRELKPALRDRVHAHLQQCETCTADLDSMASIAAQLGGVPSHEPNEAFYRRLFERLWETRERPAFVPRLVFAVGAVAVAALIGFAVLMPEVSRTSAPLEITSVPSGARTAAPVAPMTPKSPQLVAVARAPVTRRQGSGTRVASYLRRAPAPAYARMSADLPSRGDPAGHSATLKPSKPSPQEVALVSEAIFRLREATSGAGSTVAEAAEAHAEPQAEADETIRAAFQPFHSATPTTLRVGNRNGL